jgi:hypothetical protein
VLHDFADVGAADTVGAEVVGATEGAEDEVGAAVLFSRTTIVAVIVFVLAPLNNFPVAETTY